MLKPRYTPSMMDEALTYLGTNDPILAQVIKQVGRLVYTLPEDGFAFLVEAIIGQMLSSKAADTIAERVKHEVVCLTPASLAEKTEEVLRSLGLSRSKARTIKTLADACLKEPDLLKGLESLSDSECMSRLCSFKGIGPWTAKMYLIFALDRKNILPLEDGAFLQAFRFLYPDRKIEEVAQAWRPYCSLAARYLYRFLDLGYCR